MEVATQDNINRLSIEFNRISSLIKNLRKPKRDFYLIIQVYKLI